MAMRHPLSAVFFVIVVGLLLGAVFTGDRLGASARAMEFGPMRSVAVAAATPAEWLNHTLHIDRLGNAIREAVLPHLLPRETAEGPGLPPETTGSPSPDGTVTPPAEEPGETPTEPTEPTYRNPDPSAAQPLVVLISGDSMTEAFGKYLKADLIDTGVAQVTHDFRFSSGLARPDFFDWPAHLAALMTQYDPDVVVLMVGANDGQDISVNGQVLDFGSEAWVAMYAERVSATMDLIAVDGRRIYWIGQPIARSDTYSAKMRVLDDIYAAEAEGRENVVYIDTWALFTAPDGTYSAYLIGDDGESHLMRMDDGIHLSVTGAHRLTNYVVAAMAEDYGLEE